MTREEFYRFLPVFNPKERLEVNNAMWEQVYQAFKQRLLEETTACEIPEGK